LQRARVDILPGSGVDLGKFTPAMETPKRDVDVVFLFVGRLLLEKGIVAYVDVALHSY
jgi:glycosyltransferase involved in cell wall biosynthesis